MILSDPLSLQMHEILFLKSYTTSHFSSRGLRFYLQAYEKTALVTKTVTGAVLLVAE